MDAIFCLTKQIDPYDLIRHEIITEPADLSEYDRVMKSCLANVKCFMALCNNHIWLVGNGSSIMLPNYYPILFRICEVERMPEALCLYLTNELIKYVNDGPFDQATERVDSALNLFSKLNMSNTYRVEFLQSIEAIQSLENRFEL